MGKLHVYHSVDRIIINFPTKKHWSNPSHLTYVVAGLNRFVEVYQDHNISSVAFPHLGCGLGKLSWSKEVEPLVLHYLADLPIEVYIHGG
jgi:O-acetyl-ADP-ribose deacetylase (regulator of RNase III)